VKQFVPCPMPISIDSIRVWGFIVFSSMAFILQAQDHEQPQVAIDQEPAVQSINPEDALNLPPSVEISSEEKKRKASIALLAVGGIAILGVGVIAATMIWARRLRRLARNSGPPQRTAGNDFWFLKPPKLSASNSLIEKKNRPPQGDQRDEQP